MLHLYLIERYNPLSMSMALYLYIIEAFNLLFLCLSLYHIEVYWMLSVSMAL